MWFPRTKTNVLHSPLGLTSVQCDIRCCENGMLSLSQKARCCSGRPQRNTYVFCPLLEIGLRPGHCFGESVRGSALGETKYSSSQIGVRIDKHCSGSRKSIRLRPPTSPQAPPSFQVSEPKYITLPLSCVPPNPMFVFVPGRTMKILTEFGVESRIEDEGYRQGLAALRRAW